MSDSNALAVRFAAAHAPVREMRSLLGSRFSQPGQLRIVDPGQFDLVFLEWNARSSTLRPALDRARHLRVPIVLWGHGYSKRPSWWRDVLRNRLGRRASGVMLYSRTIADRLVRDGGFDRARVFVAQNAIDQAPVQNARRRWLDQPDSLEAFREQHQLDPARTVIHVSRLLPENRPEMMVHALEALRTTIPDAKLVIVGDGPARPAVEAAVRERGQISHVVFSGAIFDEQQLAPWMLSASVFLYPVNIGLSLMHAFGYGLPVVTSDDIPSHNPEIEALEDGMNGVLYRDGDVDAMADACRRLLEDQSLRAMLSSAALRQVIETYTLPNMVQGFLDAIRLVDGGERRVVVPGESLTAPFSTPDPKQVK